MIASLLSLLMSFGMHGHQASHEVHAQNGQAFPAASTHAAPAQRRNAQNGYAFVA